MAKAAVLRAAARLPAWDAERPATSEGRKTRMRLGNLIDPKELRELRESGEEPLIIDVRGPEEFEAGNVSGAVNMPVGELGGGWGRCLRDGSPSPTEICAIAAARVASGPRSCSGRAAMKRRLSTAASPPGEKRACPSSADPEGHKRRACLNRTRQVTQGSRCCRVPTCTLPGKRR